MKKQGFINIKHILICAKPYILHIFKTSTQMEGSRLG